MGFDKPARFRSPGSLGGDGLNDLEFNELGGARIPGATGSKTRPAVSALPSRNLVAFNDAGAEEPGTGGGLPDAGPPDLGANEAGRSASPNLYHPVLTIPERLAIWEGILQGASYQESLMRAKINKGPGHIFHLHFDFNIPETQDEGLRLMLLDGPLTLPAVDNIDREVLGLYRDYALKTQKEFLELEPKIARYFKDGWLTYHDLRHLYYKAGYIHPPTELNRIKDMKFLGTTVTVHPDFEVILEQAEKKLTSGPLALSKNALEHLKLHIGSFSPRPISDNKAGLSNHAIGKAIDINDATNPQFSANEAKILDAVLQWLKSQKEKGVPWLRRCNLTGPYPFSRSLPGGSLADGSTLAYRQMEQNSAWLQTFLQEAYPMRAKLKADANQAHKYLKGILKGHKAGQPDAADPNEQVARDAAEMSEKLEQLIGALARATPSVTPEHAILLGILTLPYQFFTAMAEAGARSGLDPAYQHKKDSMHFEVPPKRKEPSHAKKPKG